MMVGEFSDTVTIKKIDTGVDVSVDGVVADDLLPTVEFDENGISHEVRTASIIFQSDNVILLMGRIPKRGDKITQTISGVTTRWIVDSCRPDSGGAVTARAKEDKMLSLSGPGTRTT